jgi:hypothetical protein
MSFRAGSLHLGIGFVAQRQADIVEPFTFNAPGRRGFSCS